MRQVLRSTGLASWRRRAAALVAVVLAALAPLLTPAAPSRAGDHEPRLRRSANASPGYWMVAADGGIFSYGTARFFGSTGALRLNQPIVGMAPTPSGGGYWLVASDGGMFSFGDARFFGSTGAMRLNKPIVGMAPTPSGGGYWLVASDGGIFSFGDAEFYGSTGAIRLARPISGMAATRTGHGYWLVASDGGVFSYGDAGFFGAAPERPATGPRSVVTMVPTSSGAGYWQAAASGELLAFGDAPALGSPASLSQPIVGLAGVPAAGTLIDDGPEVRTVDEVPTTTPDLRPPPRYFASAANLGWGTSISTVDSTKAGRVLALAQAGDKVFVAGEFAGAARPPAAGDPDPGCKPGMTPLPPPDVCVLRPFLFALDARTGALLDWDAQPDGAVLSLQASPDGKHLYAGGRFTRIGGAPAGRIALLDVATATQVPGFKPPKVDSGVRAMALDGTTLYFGGSFRRLDVGVDGQPDVIQQKAQVAAVDATTGALRPGWPLAENTGGRFVGHTGTPTEDGVPGVVYDLAVSGDGRTVYVGGDFLHFGGRGGVVALDAATGAPAAWQPAPDQLRPVFGLTIWPGDGASLIIATGGKGGSIQFFTPTRGASPVWVGRTDGDATDVAATTERVYGVGHWDHGVPDRDDPCLKHVPVSCPLGTPHRKLIAYDARTGDTDAGFTAQANTDTGPYVALVGAHHLFVGGDFTEVGPAGELRPQGGFAAFDQIEQPGPVPPTKSPPREVTTTVTTSRPTASTTSKSTTTSTRA